MRHCRALLLAIFSGLLALLPAQRACANDPEVEYLDASLPAPGVKIKLAGKVETVFSADDTHCPAKDARGQPLDIPDAPVRAFRDKAGGLHVLAAHYNNLIFETNQLGRLKRTGCASAFVSKMDPDPAHFAGHEWLISAYSLPSGDVFGLVHDEYWGGLYDPYCKRRLGEKDPWAGVCVYINLTGSLSKDGRVFARQTAEGTSARTVAAFPFKFNGLMDRAGVRDPSNLMRNPKDGYVYFVATVDGYDGQKRGSCLFRSRPPFSDGWRAFDGEGFKAMANPYARQGSALVFCQPVSGLETTTLLYHKASQSFIALGHEERLRPGGVFYRTSKDLIHWSRPTLLVEAHGYGFWKGRGEFLLYPSVIDESSPSANFDTVGRDAYLYFVRVRTQGATVMDRKRDIMRIRINLGE